MLTSEQLQVLRSIQQMPTPLMTYPNKPRLLLKCEGAGPYPAHKFRSFAFVAEAALAAGVHLSRLCDRSSGSWAMAGARIGHLLGAQTRWVTVGEPPVGVRAYVEANNGYFDLVASNEKRLARVEELRAEGWWCPDQHNNPMVIDAFASTLGAQLEGQLRRRGIEIAFLVAPVGTGGLLAGVARRLRLAGHRLTAIGVDRASSIAHGGVRSWKHPYVRVRGVGSDDEVCGTLRSACDQIDEIYPGQELEAARHMLQFMRVGCGCGLSGGLALQAALDDVLPRCPADRSVLVLLPDSGLLYSDELRLATRMFEETT